MIQIESVVIRELRGIRELEIKPDRKTFVVSGPNGSGKSGVVDAIEFALTGDMSRLAGKGTQGLSVRSHGPHVDRRHDPASAEVELQFFIPDLDRTAVLTRNVGNPRHFTLEPDDSQVRALVQEVADHPEMTLSRREIIKYILAEPGTRSKEIQALLKLEAIGQTRAVMKTMSNKLAIVARQARSAVADSEESLRRHLDVATLEPEAVLEAINQHRHTLGLVEIDELCPETDASAGVLEAAGGAGFNQAAALRDVESLQNAVAGLPALCQDEVEVVLRDLTNLEHDPALLHAVTRRSFVESGLGLIDGEQCPLCNTAWEDEDALLTHLRAKLAAADEADAIQQRLRRNGAEIAKQAHHLSGLVDAVHPLGGAYRADGFGGDLETWSLDLKSFASKLKTVDAIAGQRSRMEHGWSRPPELLEDQLETLRTSILAKPDRSEEIAAQAFLTRAQDRFSTWQSTRLAKRQAEAAVATGRAVYNSYCEVADDYLRALYRAVENDFSSYYREINAEDEGGFTAKLEPAEGSLDLEVAFYDQGMYPPRAYHSEGHQDGMGLCLYLALMQRLLGDRFRLAVLDDVVMSVDRGHRKEICRLLRERFPHTQFIITTHDRVWTKQMQTERLVRRKETMVFSRWSVQTGPIVQEMLGIWDAIESDLDRGEVDTAAARLRRHMEYVASELAERLGAQLRFRGDYSYDLGELLPPVVSRYGKLLRGAASVTRRWGNEEAKAKVKGLKASWSDARSAYDDENWVVNRAVHYNEWATFTPAEFREVVEAFKRLLAELQCSSCESWLYVTPRKGTSEVLQCRCGSRMLKLR